MTCRREATLQRMTRLPTFGPKGSWRLDTLLSIQWRAGRTVLGQLIDLQRSSDVYVFCSMGNLASFQEALYSTRSRVWFLRHVSAHALWTGPMTSISGMDSASSTEPITPVYSSSQARRFRRVSLAISSLKSSDT